VEEGFTVNGTRPTWLSSPHTIIKIVWGLLSQVDLGNVLKLLGSQ
jgi:hypothetical protein